MKQAFIVIPVNLPWEWSTDYYNQTAELLARHNTVLCLLWENAVSLRELIARRKIPRLFYRTSPHLYFLQAVQYLPFRRFRRVEEANLYLNCWLVMILSLFLKPHGSTFSKKILWLFDPIFSALPRIFGPAYASLYDCVDYYPGSTQETAWKNELIRREENLVRSSDYVFAISHVLRAHLMKIKPPVHLVPQGFRSEVFIGYRDTACRYRFKKPVIGFIGGINYRLDYPLLIALARRLKRYTFVFAGPIQINNSSHFDQCVKPYATSLFSIPNVRYLSSVPKETLPALIASFDICMIPYDSAQEFNQFCYPMKLFEYFYMEKPVISTPIRELQRFPEYVSIANSVVDWQKTIVRLLNNNRPDGVLKTERRLAEKQSWERKLDAILSVLEKT